MNDSSEEDASRLVMSGMTIGPEQIEDESTLLPDGRVCEFCWANEATSWIKFRGQSKQAGITFPQKLVACPNCVDIIHDRDIKALSAMIDASEMWPEGIDLSGLLDAINPTKN